MIILFTNLQKTLIRKFQCLKYLACKLKIWQRWNITKNWRLKLRWEKHVFTRMLNFLSISLLSYNFYFILFDLSQTFNVMTLGSQSKLTHDKGSGWGKCFKIQTHSHNCEKMSANIPKKIPTLEVRILWCFEWCLED